MKPLYIRHWLAIHAAVLFGIMFTSCNDDIGVELNPSDGYTEMTATVQFQPFAGINVSDTRTPGDYISEIRNVWIVVYDKNGNLVPENPAIGFANPANIPASDFIKVESNTDVPKDFASDTPGSVQAEEVTQKATMRTIVPTGHYYVYAVANVPSLTRTDIPNRTEFKGYNLTWEDNMADNCEMSGAFSIEQPTDIPDHFEDLIEIRSTNPHMCAWLRRAASKLTIAYNTEQLSDNTWIYLKKATIKCIPLTCKLFDDNHVTANTGYKDNGESIVYGTGTDHTQWPELTRATGTYGSDHSMTSEALYFYENMQGAYPLESDREYWKQQDRDGDGLVDGFREKDNIPYGTYIEVEAYYRSQTPGNESEGNIIYRFMLGKNDTYDFNAERNHHYKLTLVFRGNANDVDWHIEYNMENENYIYVPHPFYISYLYGETTMMPIAFDGELVAGTKIKAEIIENNWTPMNAPADYYYTGQLKRWVNNAETSADYDKCPEYGFLSLCNSDYKNSFVGRHIPSNGDAGNPDRIKYLANYWKGCNTEVDANEGKKIPPQGVREYYVDAGHHTRDYNPTGYNENNGDYDIVVTNNGGVKRTHAYLPIYTRALFLVKALGFSGNNPFYTYQRKAIVRVSARIKTNTGRTKNVSRDIEVIQVRRLVNPKGIYREMGNDEGFNVTLTRRMSETSNTFEPFESIGRWDATIEAGTPNFIDLNGMGLDHIEGYTGSFVKFDVKIRPDSRPAAEQTNRYAIILVRYHDYTCTHRIIVRQGYKPDVISSESNTKWHCFNLRAGNIETTSPLDEGSLFRLNDYTHAVDASNNTAEHALQVAPTPLKVLGTKGAVDNSVTTWDGITTSSFTSGTFFTNNNRNLYDVVNTNKKIGSGRLPKYEDYQKIRDAADMAYSFGVCYADGATETQTDAGNAFSYGYYLDDSQRPQEHGMRGAFCYNTERGNNIFLPIGASGHGRRKAQNHSHYGGTNPDGILKYTNRDGLMPASAVVYMPMFWKIRENSGAIYWIEPKTFDPAINDVWNDVLVSKIFSWDINYSTFDFNHFELNAVAGNRSDGCFIRLVED